MNEIVARRAASALLCLLWLLHADVAVAESFREKVARWDALAVEAASRPADDLVLTSGRLTLELKKGRVAEVRAGEEVVGLFVSGTGTLRYRSDDPSERDAVRWATRKNTGLRLSEEEGALVLSTRFTDALWVSAGTPLPGIPAPAAEASLASSFAKHRARFDNLAARPLLHQLLHARGSGDAAPVVPVEVNAAGDDLVYLLDGLVSRSERLSAAHVIPALRTAGDDRKLLAVLSDTPLGRDRREPAPPEVFLTHVDLSVAASGGSLATVEATETFEAASGKPGVLLLHQKGTFFRPRNTGNLLKQEARVTAVRDAAGGALEFDHRDDFLAVALPSPLVPGRPVTLRFEIEGDLLHRPFGASYWLLGNEAWFPRPGERERAFTVRSRVRVKRPFTPLAPGTTVRRAEEGDEQVLETRIDKPVTAFSVLAGRFSLEEEARDGLTVRAATYAGPNTISQRNILEAARKMTVHLAGYLGNAPFDEITVVQLDRAAPDPVLSGFVFLPTRFDFASIHPEPLPAGFDYPSGGTPRWFVMKNGVSRRLARGLAEQWWGASVRSAGGGESWVPKAFSDYLAGLLVRDLHSEIDWTLLRSMWKKDARASRRVAPVALWDRVFAFDDVGRSIQLQDSLVAARGPLLLDGLREELGEERFRTLLAAVQKTFAGRRASTGDVARVLAAVSSRETANAFESRVWERAADWAR